MSVLPSSEPECTAEEGGPIELVVRGRPRDFGSGFQVLRVLPSVQRRMVGPFIFLDHMGPATLPPGQGFDVRPHPHIALATVTFLLEGEIVHRDSVGSEQSIRPGDVNWMVAGRGIAHSERSPDHARRAGARVHGIQCWVALPKAEEERAPSFEHHPARALPRVKRDGVDLVVIAGTAYGERSPVGVLSPTLYVHAAVEPGAVLRVDAEHEERAVYVVEGEVACEAAAFGLGTLLVLRRGADAAFRANARAHVALVGGAPLDGARHIFWNFVSSSRERIERAKRDWAEGRFPKVRNDETEFIPLPD